MEGTLSQLNPVHTLATEFLERSCTSLNVHKHYVEGIHSPFFSGAFTKQGKATVNLIMSVRLSVWNNSKTGRIFIKFDIGIFFKKLPRKFKFL